MTLADGLSVLRLALVTPIVAIEVSPYAADINSHLVALGLFLAAVGTDVLDGIVARATGGATLRGSILDPAADSLLVLGILATATIRAPVVLIPLAVLAVRDLVVLRVRLLLASTGTALPSSAIAKLKTACLNGACAAYLLARAAFGDAFVVLFWTLLLVGVGLALVSAFGYARSARHARA